MRKCKKEKIKLNLGCGVQPIPGYINCDKSNYYGKIKFVNEKEKGIYYKKPDILFDLNKPFPIKSNSISFIKMDAVIGHLENPEFTLEEIIRVLIPGKRRASILPCKCEDINHTWNYSIEIIKFKNGDYEVTKEIPLTQDQLNEIATSQDD